MKQVAAKLNMSFEVSLQLKKILLEDLAGEEERAYLIKVDLLDDMDIGFIWLYFKADFVKVGEASVKIIAKIREGIGPTDLIGRAIKNKISELLL